MKVSQKGLEFIRRHEALKLESYRDQKGKPTIGWGNTLYENGEPVKMGQTITKERADQLYAYWIEIFTKGVNDVVEVQLTQNQFDALVAFAYNIGGNQFKISTALKKINKDPNDPSIGDAMKLFNKIRVDGELVVSDGLINRRAAEVQLYFS